MDNIEEWKELPSNNNYLVSSLGRVQVLPRISKTGKKLKGRMLNNYLNINGYLSVNIKDKKRKTYAAMVSAVDDGVGRVLDALKEQALDEDTIIVFLSDNGGARNNGSDNGPLRGLKGDLFEGGVRVPFAIRWKGVIPEGNSYKNPVSSLDIMATIVAQTNVKINPERPLDGVDLIPFLTGKNNGAPHEYLFWRKWEQNAMAIRHGNYKLVANKKQDQEPPELFDLSTDISESKNLKSEKLKISKDLQKEWNNWNKELKERVFPALGEDNWWSKN